MSIHIHSLCHERHPHLSNKVLQLVHIRAQTKHEVKGIVRHKSKEGYRTFLLLWRSQWAQWPPSSISERSSEPPRLFGAGSLLKSDHVRRASVREVTNNPMVTLSELQSSSAESGEPSRRTTTSEASHQSGPDGSMARQKPLLCKRWAPEGHSDHDRPWSDETKIELFCVNTRNWETNRDRGNNERGNVQWHPRWKPAPTRPWPPTGVTVHLSAGHQP